MNNWFKVFVVSLIGIIAFVVMSGMLASNDVLLTDEYMRAEMQKNTVLAMASLVFSIVVNSFVLYRELKKRKEPAS